LGVRIPPGLPGCVTREQVGNENETRAFGIMKNISEFFHEVKVELSKVEWPTTNEFIGAVVVVLIVVLAFSIFLGLIDKGIGLLMKYIFTYGV
jgi:preprotein translocase subunit SecE